MKLASHPWLLLAVPVWAVAAFLYLYASTAAADRTDVWTAASVKVYSVALTKLGDGGCSVSACGSYLKADGGSISRCTEPVEVAGANRTTCLDIVDTKAPVLFKSAEGL